MNANIAPVPDLLRRFVSTPYVVSFCQADVPVRIESNDFELALEIRKLCMLRSKNRPLTVSLWKFIRDGMAPQGGTKLTLLSDGPLRTLLGSGTMMMFDRERREVLGFVAPGVTLEQMAMALEAVLGA